MRVIGIDLAGPSNHKDTVLTVFNQQNGQLNFLKLIRNIGDLDILKEIEAQSQLDEVVIGIDAPLSYEDGGGDRQGDKQLRQYIVSIGMRPGSIMPPTLNRMVYLTLRGIKLSREIGNLAARYPISIVEVHPGAVIGSRLLERDLEYVLSYKQVLSARTWIRDWFAEQKLTKLPVFIDEESHLIDACAAALGAWHWKDPSLQPKWSFPPNPPLHPFGYCC
ncbi:DUF429 domain-containing protein [Neobacillus sp. MER 74]|uniref:DUF429 domain-containing protein n=1 Tax=Neobacillus sp. MER 74 TaxID=2939566 RepID=UPI00203A9635|nr:DUF429 domain-containing protein [Neobacillus sp. MER 74]MCM3116465.1 DUF429 domain-containing protein [Neobacillus sp. MER 74]